MRKILIIDHCGDCRHSDGDIIPSLDPDLCELVLVCQKLGRSVGEIPSDCPLPDAEEEG